LIVAGTSEDGRAAGFSHPIRFIGTHHKEMPEKIYENHIVVEPNSGLTQQTLQINFSKFNEIGMNDFYTGSIALISIMSWDFLRARISIILFSF
jgi:hypothetical protein